MCFQMLPKLSIAGGLSYVWQDVKAGKLFHTCGPVGLLYHGWIQEPFLLLYNMHHTERLNRCCYCMYVGLPYSRAWPARCAAAATIHRYLPLMPDLRANKPVAAGAVNQRDRQMNGRILHHFMTLTTYDADHVIMEAYTMNAYQSNTCNNLETCGHFLYCLVYFVSCKNSFFFHYYICIHHWNKSMMCLANLNLTASF